MESGQGGGTGTDFVDLVVQLIDTARYAVNPRI